MPSSGPPRWLSAHAHGNNQAGQYTSREGDWSMDEQSAEQKVTAEAGKELIALMVPDIDPELVQLVLGYAAHSAAGGRDSEEGHQGRSGKSRVRPLQRQAELLALIRSIRDAGIDSTELDAILGLSPEASLTDGDNRIHRYGDGL